MTCSVSVVEVGGRLVEQHPRPVGDDDPGQREPGALAGRQRGAVLAERRVEPVAAGRATRSSRATRRRAAQSSSSVGVGSAEPQVVGDGAGDEARAAAAARPTWRRQAAPPTGDRRRVTEPVVGSSRPASDGEQRRLAAARRAR